MKQEGQDTCGVFPVAKNKEEWALHMRRAFHHANHERSGSNEVRFAPGRGKRQDTGGFYPRAINSIRHRIARGSHEVRYGAADPD